MDRDIRLMGEEEEAEMCGEGNMEMYIPTCETDNQWECAIWLRELKLGLCNNLEEWDRKGGGREFQEGGDIGIPMAD